MIENFVYGEINEQSLSNLGPPQVPDLHRRVALT